MGRYGNIDYTEWAKKGFLLGLGLFLLGAGGELVGHIYFGTLPAWEETLFTNMELFGILVGFLAPIVFGIALPLTE
jgi:hypothetical protein